MSQDDFKLIDSWFPLFSQEEYESTVNKSWPPVGVNLDYPVDLRERLSAASISHFMGHRTVDYTLKKYCRVFQEDPGGEVRKDRRIKLFCLETINLLTSGLREFRAEVEGENVILGEYLSDVTISRLSFSFTRAFAEADKGAMLESIVIARMILEQVSWSISVRSLIDRENIMKISATKSIGAISKTRARWGKLYGWMSNHAHWGLDAHVKVMTTTNETMLASQKFKACSYIVLWALVIEIKSFFILRLSEVMHIKTVERFKSSDFLELQRSIQLEFDLIIPEILRLYPDLIDLFPKFKFSE